MSIQLYNLLDVEKYFLSELAYVHLPGEARFSISPETPMPLNVYLRRVQEWAAPEKLPLMSSPGFQKRVRRLQAILRGSDSLKDVVISGYLNDDLGPYGNTENRWKTSLVAMAFRDGQGNGLVSISGCEAYQPSSFLTDWLGCGLAFVGVVTLHHKRALRFFDRQMRGLPGEKGVIGHSKGGNIATYIFINRLHENVSAYCINGQPYCWWVMTRAQKAALKSERYEYIAHVKDFAKKFGYISYISRTVPLSRYVKEGGLVSHDFAEVRFDEFGNLEGNRALRETKGRLKSIVFGDDISEKRLSHEESLSLFRGQMKAITQTPRLLSVGLEEIMLTMGAAAATLWLRDEDEAGPYIYPYIVKGPASEALYRLKLRQGSGIAARSAFGGEPLLTGEASQSPDFLPGVDRSTGFRTTTMITVPLQAENASLGALQILNKSGGAFDMRDLHLAADMAACMSEVFAARGGSAVGVREFRLLRVYGRDGEERFAIEQNEFRMLKAATPEEARRQRDMLLGRELAPGDWLVFNRKVFDASMIKELERMRVRDISVLELAGRRGLTQPEADAALATALEKRPMLVIADLSAGRERSAGGSTLCVDLRRLCNERIITAVVIH